MIVPAPLRRILRLARHNRQQIGFGKGTLSALKKTGVLDYASASIFMRIESHEQLEHLKSCKREPETIAWIEKYVCKDDVLYDVGANVGAFSFIAAACNKDRTAAVVYAFEPSFSTYAALCQNVILNRVSERVVPLPVALAESTEILKFHYANLNPGHAHHEFSDPDSKKKWNFTQPILAYALDDFRNRFSVRDPNHIKIDVDGGELRVLQGMRETLRLPSMKTMLVEVDERADDTELIKDIIVNSGFTITERHPRKLQGVFNYICVRKTES